MATLSGEPHLESLRFQIKRDRDGRHRWYLYNASGTIVGSHTAGFLSEREAYEDIGHVRVELAIAPIIGESEPRAAISEVVESRWSDWAIPIQETGGGK